MLRELDEIQRKNAAALAAAEAKRKEESKTYLTQLQDDYDDDWDDLNNSAPEIEVKPEAVKPKTPPKQEPVYVPPPVVAKQETPKAPPVVIPETRALVPVDTGTPAHIRKQRETE